jgi:hypothetical protein
MAVTLVSRRSVSPTTLRDLTSDLRSLGLGAPVRAVYELSKRAGGHRLVLGRLARASGPPPAAIRSTLPLPTSIDDTVRARTLEAATAIAAGRLTVFGRVIEIGDDHPPWHAVIDGRGEWPRRPWWEIDIRSDARPGDVKWAWELARHRHLVVLARAAFVDPDEERWRSTLEPWLWSWVDANPLEIGVHWASNLELALRAFTWAQVLSLAGDALDRQLVAEMARHLWHTGRHLVAELPYTVSTTPNNHLLGDALGLLVVGSLFDHPTAARWRRLGAWLFEHQARRQFRGDGSSIDDALSYHRFTLEMLLARGLVEPAPAAGHRQRVRDAADHLARLGVLDGPVPQYGDWDEGRVLTSTGDPLDLAGTTIAALAVAGDDVVPAGSPHPDELAWYPPPPPSRPPPRRTCVDRDLIEGSIYASSVDGPVDGPVDGAVDGAVGGGIARADRGPFRVWLRAGTRRWHGHADLLACEMSVDGRWAVGDPGTGTYNGDLDVRNGLRSSAAHAVLRLAGADQLQPHRVFRWRHQATARLGHSYRSADAVVLWGRHGAYRRLDPPRDVVRAVVVTTDEVVVADWVSGPPGVPFDLTLPLAPGSVTTPARRFGEGATVGLRMPGGTEGDPAVGADLRLHLPGRAELLEGSTEPWAGWWSATYGAVVPSPWLRVSGVVDGPVVWSVGSGVVDPATVRPDGRLAVETPGSTITVGVEWVGRVARLRVDEGDRQWVAAAGS